jgi:hypothetical protein
MNTNWTPESIPAETRAELRKLYTYPNYPKWDWDEDTWRWELSLFSTDRDPDECDDIWGYAYIEAYKNGNPIEYGTVPDLEHREWVIGNISDDIHITGTLQEAKAVLDNLIQPTPEIPFYAQMSIQPQAPVLTVEEFKALKPGDLVGNNWPNWPGSFLIEHVIADYPGPLDCRIYCRSQGGKNHGSLEALTLADHRELGFVRRVRKPLGELRALISSIEKGGFEPDYDVARSVGISGTQVNCLRDIVKNRPELVAALLDGTLSLDDVFMIARDAQGQPIYHNGELAYTLSENDLSLQAQRAAVRNLLLVLQRTR